MGWSWKMETRREDQPTEGALSANDSRGLHFPREPGRQDEM